LFNGKELNYEEMFMTRGYRGLNIIPFPEHVRDNIDEGNISNQLARRFGGKYMSGKVDYTNYIKAKSHKHVHNHAKHAAPKNHH